MKRSCVVVGGGPAGLAAAISAYDAGLKDIIVLEREDRLGGILNQCIHNGFGLHTFDEELMAPSMRSAISMRQRSVASSACSNARSSISATNES